MKGRAHSRQGKPLLSIIVCLFLASIFALQAKDLFAAEKEAKKSERYERGERALKMLNPEGASKTVTSLQDIAPEMIDFVFEFAYGDVFSRPGLDPKSREIATVSALTALANAVPQLKWHIGAALNIGVTPQQIIDIMYISTVYHGFPAGLNGISAAREVFKANNIQYTPQKREEISDKRTLGMKTMDATSKGAGEKVINSLKDIAPEMADFILEFAYADVFSRGNLSPRETEIVAIAGMCAVGTQRPQLIVHIKAGLNVGLTKEQIIEIMDQMAVYAGFPAALNGISAAREAFTPPAQ